MNSPDISEFNFALREGETLEQYEIRFDQSLGPQTNRLKQLSSALNKNRQTREEYDRFVAGYNKILFKFRATISSEKGKDEWRKHPQRRLAFDTITLGNICGEWLTEYDPNNYRGDPDLWWSTVEPIKNEVICWLPRAKEVQRIARFAQFVKQSSRSSDLPHVVEIGCGTGFFSYLLAKTNLVKMIGTDPDKPALIGDGYHDGNPECQTEPYQHPNLSFFPETAFRTAERFREQPIDVVVSSWMEPGLEFIKEIPKMHPKAIVYIREHVGRMSSYQDLFRPPENYRTVARWTGPDRVRVCKLMQFAHHFIPSIPKFHTVSSLPHEGNNNLIEFQLRDDIPIPTSSSIDLFDGAQYPWETHDPHAILQPQIYDTLTQNPPALAEFANYVDWLLEVAPIT